MGKPGGQANLIPARGLWLWLLVVVLVSGAVLGVATSDDNIGPGVGAAQVDPAPILADVDASGALVLDPVRGELVGVTRSAGVLWRDRAAADRLVVQCVGACPAAVASGTYSIVEGPIPQVGQYWHLPPDYTQEGLPGRDLTLFAVSRTSFVSLAPNGRLSYPDTDSTARQLDIGSSPLVSMAADRRRHLIISTTSEGNRATLLVRQGGGWLATTIPTAARTSCLGKRSLAYVTNDSIIVVAANGDETIIRASAVGACSLTESSLLAVTLLGRSGGATTTVSCYDLPSADQRWSVTASGLSLPSLSSMTDETVWATGGEAMVFSPEGEVTGRHSGVADARFIETGELVLLRNDGTVEWLPR